LSRRLDSLARFGRPALNEPPSEHLDAHRGHFEERDYSSLYQRHRGCQYCQRGSSD
jgi:hypothetical protein